jgi:hypothetical protein
MTIRRTVLALAAAALIILALPAAAAEETVQSMWASAPLTVDGVPNEWDESTPIIDNGSKLEYALRNDGLNLYIIMVFRNPQPGTRANVYPKSTLDYTGMKIYFTTGDKKRKDYGVLFQKKQYTADALIASLEQQGRTLTEERKAEIRKKETHIVFTEELIKPRKAEVEPLGDADPPMFRTIDQGPLTVGEFRIPLARIGVQPGQTVKLGFDWGGMTNQILRDMMAGRADQSVAAADRGVSAEGGWRDSSGEGGGEIRGMGGGVGEMGRNPRYKKHAFWIDAKLAAGGN